MRRLFFLLESYSQFKAGGYSLLFFLFIAASALFSMAAWWRIYTKTGLEGWKSLIPYYSGFLEYRFAWNTKVFWVQLALVLFMLLAEKPMNFYIENMSLFPPAATLLILIGLLVLVATKLVLEIMFRHHLAKSFGMPGSFTVALVLLNPIFLGILSFGKAEYLGPYNPRKKSA